MASITSANSVLVLSVAGLFDAPQQIQGYDVDDAFMAQAVRPSETKMGVDGKLSGGYVPVQTPVEITLQADSASNLFFEAWYNAQQASQNTFIGQGLLTLPSIGEQYAMTVGFLTGYPPFSAGKKVLGPRKYEVTFERVVGAPAPGA